MNDGEKYGGDQSPAPCGVWPASAATESAATSLASCLGLQLMPPDVSAIPYRLMVHEDGLELRDVRPGAPGGLRAALDRHAGSLQRYRNAAAAGEGLLRAIGARRGHRPQVIDATAGLGRDALVMAAAGCDVHMIERSRVLAAMIANALENPPDALVDAARRLRLTVGDAHRLLPQRQAAEVVYLDPMYAGGPRRALQGKDMQLLQGLLGPQPDPEMLLRVALRSAGRRVVVKRPRKAPYVGDTSPHHSITGRSTRFDVYLVPLTGNGP